MNRIRDLVTYFIHFAEQSYDKKIVGFYNRNIVTSHQVVPGFSFSLGFWKGFDTFELLYQISSNSSFPQEFRHLVYSKPQTFKFILWSKNNCIPSCREFRLTFASWIIQSLIFWIFSFVRYSLPVDPQDYAGHDERIIVMSMQVYWSFLARK